MSESEETFRLLMCRRQAMMWAIELFELTPEKLHYFAPLDEERPRRTFVAAFRASLNEIESRLAGLRHG